MDRSVENSSLQIFLLGRYIVKVNERTVADSQWQRRHAKQLVKMLALSPKNQLHREQIMEQLWPESSPRKSANNLNKVIYMARRALEPQLNSGSNSQFLKRTGDSITLCAEGELSIDVQNFEASALQAIEVNSDVTLSAALALYQGDLLIEDPFDEIFSEKRESLSNLYQRVLIAKYLLAEQRGAIEKAIELLNELISLDNVNEDYHRRLMQQYAISGQRSKALAQYALCERAIAEELAELPEYETRELADKIRAGTLNQDSINSVNSQVTSAATSMDTLAVIPFVNTSEDPELEYLCDGISDDLIIKLSSLPGLRVLARSTVFRFKRVDIDPIEIGQQLSADTLILGRVQYQGERLQIWVERVDASDRSILWANQYEATLSEVLELRTALTSDVVRELSLAIRQEYPQALHQDTENVSAYHDYLKGRYLWNKRSGVALQQALHHFSAAIDNDPIYTLAYSGLADAYNVMSLYTAASPKDTMPKAKAAAYKALDIDPRSSAAHTSLAYCQLSYDWNFMDAEKSFRTALSLDPNYATAHQWYHKLLVSRGRFTEADQQIELAYYRDPLSLMISTEKAWGLYYSRRYSKAIDHLRNLLVSDPGFAIAHFILGLCYLQESLVDEAIAELNLAIEQQGEKLPFVLAIGTLGYALTLRGEDGAAIRQLDTLGGLSNEPGVVSYAMAMIQAGLGNVAQTTALLHRACDERIDRLIFLDVDPILEKFKTSSGYKALADRIATQANSANPYALLD
ncbi:MAG: tetratricopeptide repeat protein [Gammaproteobacteria bacterium]|nr:tetratricopeptide repeat protein [Gammaproteobacteria bacterium]